MIPKSSLFLSQSEENSFLGMQQQKSPSHLHDSTNIYNNNIIVLEQKIKLIESQLKESLEREENLKKINNSLMKAFNQINFEKGGSKEIEILSEQYNKELKQIRTQYQGTIKQLEKKLGKIKEEHDQLEKKLQQKDEVERMLKAKINDVSSDYKSLQQQKLQIEDQKSKLRQTLDHQTLNITDELKREKDKTILLMEYEREQMKNEMQVELQKNLELIQNKFDSEKTVLLAKVESVLQEKQAIIKSKEESQALNEELKSKLNDELKQAKIQKEQAYIKIDKLEKQVQTLKKQIQDYIQLDKQIKNLEKDKQQIEKEKLELQEIQEQNGQLKILSSNQQEQIKQQQIKIQQIEGILTDQTSKKEAEYKDFQNKINNERLKYESLQKYFQKTKEELQRKNGTILKEILTKDDKIRQLQQKLAQSQHHNCVYHKRSPVSRLIEDDEHIQNSNNQQLQSQMQQNCFQQSCNTTTSPFSISQTNFRNRVSSPKCDLSQTPLDVSQLKTEVSNNNQSKFNTSSLFNVITEPSIRDESPSFCSPRQNTMLSPNSPQLQNSLYFTSEQSKNPTQNTSRFKPAKKELGEGINLTQRLNAVSDSQNSQESILWFSSNNLLTNQNQVKQQQKENKSQVQIQNISLDVIANQNKINENTSRSNDLNSQEYKISNQEIQQLLQECIFNEKNINLNSGDQDQKQNQYKLFQQPQIQNDGKADQQLQTQKVSEECNYLENELAIVKKQIKTQEQKRTTNSSINYQQIQFLMQKLINQITLDNGNTNRNIEKSGEVALPTSSQTFIKNMNILKLYCEQNNMIESFSQLQQFLDEQKLHIYQCKLQQRSYKKKRDPLQPINNFLSLNMRNPSSTPNTRSSRVSINLSNISPIHQKKDLLLDKSSFGRPNNDEATIENDISEDKSTNDILMNQSFTIKSLKQLNNKNDLQNKK